MTTSAIVRCRMMISTMIIVNVPAEDVIDAIQLRVLCAHLTRALNRMHTLI